MSNRLDQDDKIFITTVIASLAFTMAISSLIVYDSHKDRIANLEAMKLGYTQQVVDGLAVWVKESEAE